MRIDNNLQVRFTPVQKYNYTTKPLIKSESINSVELQSYPQVYFVGNKILGKNYGNSRLLKQINEILLEDNPDEEINKTELNFRAIKYMASMARRAEDLHAEMELLMQDKTKNNQQKYSRGREIIKEIHRMANIKTLYVTKPNYRPFDEKTDYALVNKFKSAILSDKFNFSQVFLRHYASLQDIKTLEELHEKYPHIKIPKRPEQVIAQKLESTITRDFYESLDDAFENKNKKAAQEMISEKVLQLFNENIKAKSQQEKDEICAKLIKPTVKTISVKYYKLRNTGRFSSVPEFRKQNKNLITDTDLKLLSLDYDDFVLTVIKEQYQNFKKPNDITYTKDGKTIKVSSIKDKDYMFDKIPNRIKSLIFDAEQIRKSYRNYKNYTVEDFKNKLEFYADRLGYNEEFLEHVLKFHSCKFGKGDIEMLTKFLQETDKVWDNEQTMENLLDYVWKNSISPKETEQINKREQQKQIAKIREENKKIAKLNNVQNEFDNYMNILYANNLNYLANTCSKYRPNSLDDNELEFTKYITNLLSANINGTNLKNKEKVETKLMHLSTYMDYLNSNPQAKIFLNAQKYATNSDGNIDIDKAGQYIMNAEFIDNYPNSLQYAKNQEIVKKIVENTNKEKAIEYLCKYDDYTDYSKNEKAKISNILTLFDLRKPLDKSLIRIIVENDYLKSDTHAIAKMTEHGSKKVKTTISANAKQEIADYYKFPKCLEYFSAFEDAMTRFAANKNSSGIKKVISKNAAELKIAGHDDRLFAYNDTLYFDEFSNTGLH